MIKAVAGVLIKDNYVFMTSRPLDKVYAGSWEFPGGKLEANETATFAVIRELKEEIGIKVDVADCQLLTKIHQNYEHGNVELEVFIINKWLGEPVALERQNFHWQDIMKPCELEPLLITTQQIFNLLKEKII